MTRSPSDSLDPNLARVAALCALLAEPARCALFVSLDTTKGCCVTSAATDSGMSCALASHHLRALERGGLLAAERSGREVCYSVAKTKEVRAVRTFIRSLLSH